MKQTDPDSPLSRTSTEEAEDNLEALLAMSEDALRAHLRRVRAPSNAAQRMCQSLGVPTPNGKE